MVVSATFLFGNSRVTWRQCRFTRKRWQRKIAKKLFLLEINFRTKKLSGLRLYLSLSCSVTQRVTQRQCRFTRKRWQFEENQKDSFLFKINFWIKKVLRVTTVSVTFLFRNGGVTWGQCRFTQKWWQLKENQRERFCSKLIFGQKRFLGLWSYLSLSCSVTAAVTWPHFLNNADLLENGGG